MKHLIEELNEKTYTYKYTLVEGDALKDKFEKISFEVQLEASSNGGTISKMKSKYYNKGDFMITEEDIKAGKEKVLGMYKVVEAYLLQNPEVLCLDFLVSKLVLLVSHVYYVAVCLLLPGFSFLDFENKNHTCSNFNCMKHLIEELNEETYTYKYTLVEGDALKDKFEKISFEVQLEASSDGGTISKMKSKYYTKGDFVLTEEDIKAGKEKVLGMYKVVEAYLLQNPDAYV
ncbi:hypothetical protein F0562_035465 [Nyssa sinensis]|uniref:Bet v I/Major latex protein domain-containing protein n=1 Tax=Nyssa sinensis TaxID=561372 RepID=A0A5J5AD28_9ASTE|nr:hypothetical protein F0562_035465 [Nyssa sinensis]